MRKKVHFQNELIENKNNLIYFDTIKIASKELKQLP